MLDMEREGIMDGYAAKALQSHLERLTEELELRKRTTVQLVGQLEGSYDAEEILEGQIYSLEQALR